ncbi:MAG: TetR family transcriptional regulator [Kiritimatiellaceae bacterium]|nr:TetR family transcriptional regulator [Kiritimatiellaceae bacterium]
MARKTKEDAQATRESVLIAALDLFSEKGYSRTTFADIAKKIGMTRGAVYWHFDNKPALLAAMVDYFCGLREDRVRQHFSEIHSLEELREAFLEHARAVVEDKRLKKFEFFMAFQMEWSEELLTETHKILDRIRKDPFEKLIAILRSSPISNRFRKDVDPEKLAVTLAGLWVGLCKFYLGSCPKIDLVSAAADGFDCIMNGVLKKEVTA